MEEAIDQAETVELSEEKAEILFLAGLNHTRSEGLEPGQRVIEVIIGPCSREDAEQAAVDHSGA